MDEDNQQPSPAGRRKGKFKPKAPPQRKPKPEVVKDSNNNEDEAALARKLMTKFNENLRRKVPKVEKKSDVQVVFGQSSTPSTTPLKKYGVPDKQKNVATTQKNNDEETETEYGAFKYLTDEIDAFPLKIKQDYREPWDYNHSYYPTTLPLRRPYSSDPELLNEAEFGDVAKKSEYDENTINPSLDLGLLEESDRPRLLFFQVPPKLPIVKRSASAKGKEKVESSTSAHAKGKGISKQENGLEVLQEGFMGKMVVYKSGAVKLKLGDTLYDVSTGSDCVFAQDVMAINTAAKECWTIGELKKRAVVTPDVDSLLNSMDLS